MSKAQPYEGVVGCCDGCGAENVRIYRSEVGWTCVSCVLEEDQDEAYVSLYLEVAQGTLAAEHERADEQQQSAVYLAGKLAEVDTERLALIEAMEEVSRCIQDENPRHALHILHDAMNGAPQRIPAAPPSSTAIAPFARLYEAARGLVGDDWVVGRVNDSEGAVYEVTMGDLKRLIEGEQQTNEHRPE
jgi:hypothetical protein